MVRQIKRAGRTSILSYPKTFHARQIAANGTKLHVRVGGTGPAVALLHGYGETGDMWVPLANDLERDRTVIVKWRNAGEVDTENGDETSNCHACFD